MTKNVEKETEEAVEETKPQQKQQEDTVTISKDALDELLKRVQNVESKQKVFSVYPLIVTKPEFINKKDGQYSASDIDYFQKLSYYEGYPKIAGGRVEYTGKLYQNDDTYKSMLKGSAPVCLCGKVKDLDTLNDSSMLFVPGRGVWVCNSSNCEQQYHRRFGGFERLVSRHLFARDVPYYGQQLPDQNDPCTRRGIHPDVRMNEFNF